MAEEHTIYTGCVVHALEWDMQPAEIHRLEFTGETGEPHVTMFGFEPIIAHCSDPRNRLHRWLLQPGTRCQISLPKKAEGIIKIEITDYADQQYIPGVYTNHEGKTEIRSMVPLRVRMEATKWHGLTHTITGWDRDRQAERSYALAEWDFTQAGIARFNDQQVDRMPVHPMTGQREQCADNPIVPVGVPL